MYTPHCAEWNKNYTADVLSTEKVQSVEECATKCHSYDNSTCKNWFYMESLTDKTCQLLGEKSGEATDVKLNDTTAYFGSKDCQPGAKIAALPQEAEQLSYKETCLANQYKEETRINNTWNREYCPSKFSVSHPGSDLQKLLFRSVQGQWTLSIWSWMSGWEHRWGSSVYLCLSNGSNDGGRPLHL